MIQRTMTMVAVAALLTMSPDIAVAQPISTYPGLSVAFRDPIGAGSTTASFEVWMRIVNTAPTDFNFNGSAPRDAFALPLMDLPRLGRDASGALASFADYTSAFLMPFWDCGNFNNSCAGPGPYDFDFNVGANSFYGIMNLSIAKNGGVYDYLLGTLRPDGGSALQGTYNFFNSGFFLGIIGVGGGGVPLNASVDLVAAACANGDTHPDCNFVRTVGESVDPHIVTPEPVTFFLLGGGFAALMVVRIRRRRHS